MKCWGCDKEFGTETRVEEISVCEVRRSTPIIGIQDKIEDEVLYNMDYNQETEEDGDLYNHWFACEYCGTTIPDDNVESIVRSYKMED